MGKCMKCKEKNHLANMCFLKMANIAKARVYIAAFTHDHAYWSSAQ